MASSTPSSDRVRVRRLPARGDYDRATIDAVLDEGLIAHVGFVAPHGPVVLPMVHARVDDTLYLHGAVGNAMLRTLVDGGPACVTVTLVDGLVLARSAFHHSMNYRCAVVYGVARRVTEAEELACALDALVDHVQPGRAEQARRPNESELRATLVLALPITEASAKVRTGPPLDDEDDLGLPVWAGVVPLTLHRGTPLAAPGLDPALPAPQPVSAADG